MKKILLFIMASFMLMAFAGCSEETTEVEAEAAFNEQIDTTNVNDLTVEEALYLTVQDLYNVPELSDTVKTNVLNIFNALEDSAVLVGIDTTDDNNSEISVLLPKIGTVNHAAIASALFQMLYKEVEALEVPTDESSTIATLKSLLTYSIMDNETAYQEVRNTLVVSFAYYLAYQSAVLQGENAAYTPLMDAAAFLNEFINDFGTYIVVSQDAIAEVMEIYTGLLVDSSSSASKNAGGAGVVSSSEYLVSANAAYTLAEILVHTGVVMDFDVDEHPEKIDFLASVFYGLTDETKLKFTYNTHLAYFEVTDAVEHIYETAMLSLAYDVLTDINETEEVPGGVPYPATWVTTATSTDDSLVAHGFVEAYDESGNLTADIRVYQSIGNYLLASPTGNDIYTGADYAPLDNTNRVKNNMLTIYKQLKQLGLQAPLYTTEIGANALAEIIATHLRESGVIYLYANAYTATTTGEVGETGETGVDETETETETEEESDSEGESESESEGESEGDGGISITDLTFAQKFAIYSAYLFVPDGDGNIPACELIEEYNLAIANAAIGRPANTGYYDINADGGTCGITIEESERKDFSTAYN